MSDEIIAGGITEYTSEPGSLRKFTPMQIGRAVVYIEQLGTTDQIESDSQIYPAAPGMKEAFEMAVDALRECIHMVGEQVNTLVTKARPDELELEFSLNFEAKGQATVIPVLVTGKAGAGSGIKIRANWQHPKANPP